MSLEKFKGFETDCFVYLGEDLEETVYWAVDVGGDGSGVELGRGGDGFCFVELRTLMVATDWGDARAMGELAIAGHVMISTYHDLILLLAMVHLSILRFIITYDGWLHLQHYSYVSHKIY